MAESEAKKKLLLIAYRAFGDHMYWSPLIPYLTSRYDVYLETNTKGWLIFHDDPRFKQVARYTDFETAPRENHWDMFQARWAKVREQVKPDIEINLNGTLEVLCIAENFQDEFYLPVGERRAIFGYNGFIDTIFKRAGIPVPANLDLDVIHFTDEQKKWITRWREVKHKDDFVVVIPIAGSTAQKVFHSFKDVALGILDRYPEAYVYLAGDEACRVHFFEHPRVGSMIGGDRSIKQTLHMVKYADMVIGPETYLLASAGMFGTPKIILATTSSVWQMTQFQKNDFSIQAPIHCSPCHRAIYFDSDCESPVLDEAGQFLTTSCSKLFRTEDILQRVGYVHTLWKENRIPPSETDGTKSSPHLLESSSVKSGGTILKEEING